MDMPDPNGPRPRAKCTSCVVRELCLPPGLSRNELESAEQLVSTRLRIRRGGALYRCGDAFKSLYVVWRGSVKSTVTADDAREQITGFHMPGDMMGFDGLGAGSHTCDAVALEDSEVCVFPYSRIDGADAVLPGLRRHFYQQMSRELVRKHESMLMLGSMRADERLATFLLNLSDRFDARGYSRREFVLRMTRADIGSFLGITLETVSRLMSQFARQGLIDFPGLKRVRIADRERLGRVALGRETAPDRGCGPAADARAGGIAQRRATKAVRVPVVEAFA